MSQNNMKVQCTLKISNESKHILVFGFHFCYPGEWNNFWKYIFSNEWKVCVSLFQYVSSGLDSFLEAFNKTREEIIDAVTKLSSAQYDFQNAAEAFKNSTQKLDLNIFLEPEYLTG